MLVLEPRHTDGAAECAAEAPDQKAYMPLNWFGIAAGSPSDENPSSTCAEPPEAKSVSSDGLLLSIEIAVVR